MSDIEKIIEFIKKNIPNAEIYNVNSTKGILKKDCSYPHKEGIIIMLNNL